MTESAWNSSELSVAETVDVALDSDQILQKYLSRRIAYERELRVLLSTGEEVDGFITGFDKDGWIQLSTAEEKCRDLLIKGDSVVLIEETGKSLRDMSIMTQARIRDYSYTLKKVCEQSIRRRPRTSNNDRDTILSAVKE